MNTKQICFDLSSARSELRKSFFFSTTLQIDYFFFIRCSPKPRLSQEQKRSVSFSVSYRLAPVNPLLRQGTRSLSLSNGVRRQHVASRRRFRARLPLGKFAAFSLRLPAGRFFLEVLAVSNSMKVEKSWHSNGNDSGAAGTILILFTSAVPTIMQLADSFSL